MKSTIELTNTMTINFSGEIYPIINVFICPYYGNLKAQFYRDGELMTFAVKHKFPGKFVVTD